MSANLLKAKYSKQKTAIEIYKDNIQLNTSDYQCLYFDYRLYQVNVENESLIVWEAGYKNLFPDLAYLFHWNF